MDAKNKIIRFMQWKNRKLSKLGVDYFTEKDEKEIRNWTEDMCIKIWRDISYPNLDQFNGVFDHIDFVDDTNICPFCVERRIIKSNCNTCGYAENHGKCYNLEVWDSIDSTYDKILDKIYDMGPGKVSICGYIGKTKIVRKIKRLNKIKGV